MSSIISTKVEYLQSIVMKRVDELQRINTMVLTISYNKNL